MIWEDKLLWIDFKFMKEWEEMGKLLERGIELKVGETGT